MKLKLGIVGPSGCGKTLIANILGNEMSMDNSIGRPPYRPTNSVRIVEFSVPSVDLRKYSAEVDVQIWEIGGNPRLKSIWPGVQLNLDAIILVYDTNNELHVRDMSALHMHFVTHSNLNPLQCLIIGNQFRGQREVGPAKIVGVPPRIRHFAVNVDDDPNYLREEFRHFLGGVAQFCSEQPKLPNSSMNPNYITPHKSYPTEGEGDGPPTTIFRPEPLKRRSFHLRESHVNDDNDGDPYTHPMYYEHHTSSRQNGSTTARSGTYQGNDSSLAITASMEALRVSDQQNPFPTENHFMSRSNNTGNRRIARNEFSIHKKSSKNHETSRI